MAEAIAAVFQTFPGREQLDPQNAKSIAEVNGHRSTFVGRKLEDPATFVVYTGEYRRKLLPNFARACFLLPS